MSSMYNKSLRMRKQLDPGEEQKKSVARGNGRGKLHGSLETGGEWESQNGKKGQEQAIQFHILQPTDRDEPIWCPHVHVHMGRHVMGLCLYVSAWVVSVNVGL